MYEKFPAVEEGSKVEKSAMQNLIANSAMSLANEAMAFGICIGRIGFLLPASHYCEVIDHASIEPLSNPAPWINGVLNLRGNDVPVFDLHVAISEDLPDPDNRCLCLIGEGDKAAALWIDGVPEVKGSALFPPVKDLAKLPVLQYTDNAKQRGLVWFKMNFDDLFEALGSQRCGSEGVDV